MFHPFLCRDTGGDETFLGSKSICEIAGPLKVLGAPAFSLSF